MKLMLVNLLLLLSVSAFAQKADDCDSTPAQVSELAKVAQVAAASTTCPNKTKLTSICLMIGNRMKDPKPIDFNEYMYNRRILEASCVDPEKDSEEEKIKKIQKMWSQFEGELVCNSLTFDVVNGSYLKFAVANKFDEFINDVIDWKVNLNRVDASDGRTVLDYLKFQIDKNKGNAIERKLKHYYDILKAAGAKHKAEL